MNLRRDSRSFAALLLAFTIGSTSIVQAKRPGGPGGGGEGPTPAHENPAIAFVTDTGGRQDVVIASADLASEIVLTQSIQGKRKGVYTHLFGSPAWSPDGSMVAFTALDLPDSTFAREQLYVAQADGSQVRLVRDFRSWPTLHRPNYTGGLSWSPSGAEIVYSGYQAIVAKTGRFTHTSASHCMFGSPSARARY